MRITVETESLCLCATCLVAMPEILSAQIAFWTPSVTPGIGGPRLGKASFLDDGPTFVHTEVHGVGQKDQIFYGRVALFGFGAGEVAIDLIQTDSGLRGKDPDTVS